MTNDPAALVRTSKMMHIPDLYDEKPTPKGLDLYQQIIWGLESRGIVLTETQSEKIKRACLE